MKEEAICPGLRGDAMRILRSASVYGLRNAFSSLILTRRTTVRAPLLYSPS